MYSSIYIYVSIYVSLSIHTHTQYIDRHLSTQAVGERQAGVTTDIGENDMYLSISIYLPRVNPRTNLPMYLSLYTHVHPYIYII